MSAPPLGTFGRAITHLTVALALGASGCATPRPKFVHTRVPPAVAVPQPFKVRSAIPARWPVIRLERASGIGGTYVASGLFDLLGFAAVKLISDAAASSANESRRKNATARVARLGDGVKDVDFRQEFWKALREEVGRSPWVEATAFEELAEDDGPGPPGRPRQPVVGQGDTHEQGVLALRTVYALSTDAAILVVRTDAALHHKGSTYPSYSTQVAYWHGPAVVDADDAAIERWTARGGTAYREAVREAASETMRMLRLDLLDAAGVPAEQGGELVQVKFRNEGSAVVSLEGRALDARDDRVILRDANGYLCSVPTRAPLPPPAPAPEDAATRR